MEHRLPTVLGSIAGLLSTSSFVPQVMKAIREGDTAAISKRMYMVTVTAFVLWIRLRLRHRRAAPDRLQLAVARAQRHDPGPQDPQRPPRGLIALTEPSSFRTG